MSLLISNL
ncbi:hypothetical protein FOXB_03477 [Fusarium oxysporum f. sp. conglutinans Fo5176]|uniref:Uncharacterized protein n=1 Tax=Fusarium oxysporum (strain Fo5176) TaxID=660025 RepID=F9FAQ1_FUSOF|nr:hypothetical protein FOXB_03477 [Fusarium oxysporum f. sp. conglutinans Fo5176]